MITLQRQELLLVAIAWNFSQLLYRVCWNRRCCCCRWTVRTTGRRAQRRRRTARRPLRAQRAFRAMVGGIIDFYGMSRRGLCRYRSFPSELTTDFKVLQEFGQVTRRGLLLCVKLDNDGKVMTAIIVIIIITPTTTIQWWRCCWLNFSSDRWQLSIKGRCARVDHCSHNDTRWRAHQLLLDHKSIVGQLFIHVELVHSLLKCRRCRCCRNHHWWRSCWWRS